MHGNAELKRFTNTRCFYTRADAAPKRRVEQHHIDCCIQNISRELFEIDDDGIRRERHTDLLTHTPHSVHAKHRVFEIVVANVFDLLTKPNRSFSGPNTVWIEPEAIAF